ncbi:serine/threonine-protein kinase gad8 [Xylariaceae sp. FL1651]|nr:serine/threonine-protein kinase gad8 [Xylariaceae sp. FL1651]
MPSSSDSAALTTTSNLFNSEPLSQASVVKPAKAGVFVQYQDAFTSQCPTNSHSTGDKQSMTHFSRPTPSSRPQTTLSGRIDRPRTSSGHGFKGILTIHGLMQVFIDSIDGRPENPFGAGSNTEYKFDVSRVEELTIHLFIRNPTAPPVSGRTQDIFLGVVHLNPRFEAKLLEDEAPRKKDSDKLASDFGGIGWVHIQNGTGKLQIGVDYIEEDIGKLKINDFELSKVIGRGNFGKLRQAKIISRSGVAYTLAERSVLAQISNPFIVPLKFTFQSPENLYFVLAFVYGGELFYHLSQGRFDIDRSRFYTAELPLTLFDYQGHIAFCDFGLWYDSLKSSMPHLTIEILLYEILTGLPPFYDENTDEIYRKILVEPLHFPGSDVVPPAAKDILTKLLNRDPSQRFGANAKLKLVFCVQANALDTTNISPEFTSEASGGSYVDDPVLSQSIQQPFVGFSYRRPVPGLNDAGGSIRDPSFIDDSDDRE